MFWGRARDRPLKGSGIPGIRGLLRNGSGFIAKPGTNDIDGENDHSDENYESSDRNDGVPKVEAVFGTVSAVATRHPLQTDYVHRSKGHVEAHQQDPKVPLS